MINHCVSRLWRTSAALGLIVLMLAIPVLSQETTSNRSVTPKVATLKLKSESTAFVLSFLGTAVPMGIPLAIGMPAEFLSPSSSPSVVLNLQTRRPTLILPGVGANLNSSENKGEVR